jgi:hypothetical protein
MAKRLVDEKPYTPLDNSLISHVLRPSPPVARVEPKPSQAFQDASPQVAVAATPPFQVQPRESLPPAVESQKVEQVRSSPPLQAPEQRPAVSAQTSEPPAPQAKFEELSARQPVDEPQMPSRLARRTIARARQQPEAVTPGDSNQDDYVLSSERPITHPDALVERMDATLRLRCPVRDKREFEAFVARLGTTFNTTLKPSNLLRAMLTVLQNAEPALSDAARREPAMKRPPNDDLVAYADFEHRLVRLVDVAIRRSTPLK